MSNEIVQSSVAAPLSATGHGLRNALVLAGLVAIWALAFWPTLSDMIAIWLRSDTFAHGMVVLPIAAYLVWLRRKPLGEVAIRPALWMLLPLLGAALAWALGVAFSIAALEHLAATLVLVLLIWTCVGHVFFRLIAFPAFFLMFMAPVGDFLVPILMHYTAEFTVGALRLSGIPVFQEGTNFVLPNGRWSVVEACSGVRYLIASFMVGTLFAYLNFRRLKKRVLFVAAALLVPIIANWLRAYLIVMLGYLSDHTLAAGVDHLIYGWVFFGIVILLLFWVGSRWRDEEFEPTVGSSDGRRFRGMRGGVTIALAAGLLAACAWSGNELRPTDHEVDIPVTLPVAADGWRTVDRTSDYRPRLTGYRGMVEGAYVHDGHRVLLTIALYAHQVPGREMVSWGNKLWPSDNEWGVLSQAMSSLPTGDAERLRLSGPRGRFMVWHWYQVGEATEARASLAVARLAASRLLGRSDVSAHVIVAVDGEEPADAERLVESFLSDHREALSASVDAALAGTGP